MNRDAAWRLLRLAGCLAIAADAGWVSTWLVLGVVHGGWS